MYCEGIIEAEKGFCCSAVKSNQRIYFSEKSQVFCSPEMMEICSARSRILKNKQIGEKDEGKPSKEGPVELIR